MGQLVGKIVLTGGPCAGKTTALTRIEQELSERGYRVFVVGESATELIKGGIKPFGNNAFNLLNFQRLILEYQTGKEKIYETAIAMLPEDEKAIIVYDRGLMDNKAYIPLDFRDIITEKDLNELEMLDNYDMVLHLVTAADGCPEFYTLENNQARSESVEEAIALDKRTQNAWVGHNRLVIIDNSTSFEDKLGKVLENIYQLVNSPYGIQFQRKYLVDLKSSNLDFLNDEGVTTTIIEQSYLEDEHENYERRLRKREHSGGTGHYLTVQKKAPDALTKIVTDKKVTEKEYLRLLEMSTVIGTVKKTRYTFVYKKQYLRLDIFEDGLGILECNPMSASTKINIPTSLKIEKEVTDDHDFDNLTFAKKRNNKKVKK